MTRNTLYTALSGRILVSAGFVLAFANTAAAQRHVKPARQPAEPPAPVAPAAPAATAQIPGFAVLDASGQVRRWLVGGVPAAPMPFGGAGIRAIAVGPQGLFEVDAHGLPSIWSWSGVRLQLGTQPDLCGRPALAVSQDGSIIAVGGADAHISIFSGATLHQVARFRGHAAPVRCLAFAPADNLLVSGGDDRLVRVWRAPSSGVVSYRYDIPAHDGAVTGVAVAPNDSAIASVSTDGYLKTWSLQSGDLMYRARVSQQAVLCVAWSPNSRRLATGSADGKVRVWRVVSGAPSQLTADTGSAVHAIVWSGDGAVLLAGSEDGSVRCFAVTGVLIKLFAGNGAAARTIVLTP
ncbi:MAG: WD40 repeat domain-containing protein [Armatimonadetes bacterium]|nr:WD40 repeat domain-containing protein [Armatimonadota bacterium]MDE2207469.1 WD40 repeat domain-containing protein [Armatimonadota bacterium]